ncbi:conserved Plasmodium protein, unknown function [Plasmodium knowlesi strain H]|uniref:Helicase-associated domain-containing protein n=3 Tax=Plasmodium knowlesi TaxID=5850 RepID=A0A5K1UFW1_PLAKH|nr:conserved protein, unknown function [Plasmodium knowlesi strain H]OTN65541.1 Uncharacterized protein PKNOH_S110116400 [Plasmodium knowlesi]CAA9989780.1 conserved protein, unknown function [Plasmodium knowlesi strain H]SBO22931.1 conserved Plasmodium protein, unknown function [Plasmodium knowlesi strain H]SBO22966.1 conserved Plasmodium protein, unknown function [Plasmodium knowlesi strain H]VVS79254.1 conserved protein, unknown function [Plasmodium knowlesi strain H]|eukprot:XP_002260503.1 hypothetical protein, conserved in Plasmodium species [Plasmodium knowlesi strain H]
MKNYAIFQRDEKKLFFEKFKRDITNLLKIYNVFFIIGILEFEEFIKLAIILYEKKFHTLNENSRLCISFPDRIFSHCYNLIDYDLKDFFTPLLSDHDDENESVQQNDRIALLDEATLLQKILLDPLLIEFNVIILTNVHRRLVKTDLILSLLKKILLKRNDLVIFIFSNCMIGSVLTFFSSYQGVPNCAHVEASSVGEEEEDNIVSHKGDVSNSKKWEVGIEQQENEDDGRVEVRGEKSLGHSHRGKQISIAMRETHFVGKIDKGEGIKEDGKGTDEYASAKGVIHRRESKGLPTQNERSVDKSLKEKEDSFPEYHIYKNRHERRNYGTSNIGGKKHFSIKNKKMKDIIRRKEYYMRSRSNTLSSDEGNKENCLPGGGSENLDLSHSDEEKGRNVRNSLFEHSAKHCLMYNQKEDADFINPSCRNLPHNGKDQISKKLEEWKKFAEGIGKVNKEINLFVFHISNESNSGERRGSKTGEPISGDIYYLKNRCANYLRTCIVLASKLFRSRKRSRENVLIFLNNEQEIDVVKRGLENGGIENSNIEIVNDMAEDDPDWAELRDKIIILKDAEFFYKKIQNVKYIIDPCFVKDEIYDYDLNVTNKYTIMCSRNKCEERRLVCSDTICYRLITEDDYMNLLKESCIPEILKRDIFYNIFFLKTLGMKNICSFDFVTAPMVIALKRCFEMLYILKLMDMDGNVTDKKLSLLICHLPLKFKYSVFLLNSIKYRCVYEVVVIVSMLINEPIFLFNHKNVDRVKAMRLPLMAEESDLLSYYNIFQNFEKAKDRKSFCYDNFLAYKSIKRATKFFYRLKKILHNFDIELEKSNNVELILKAKICSFFYNVSKVVGDNSYKLLNGRGDNELLYLDQLSILNESEQQKRKFIVYTDAYSNNESRIFVRHASIIDPLWLITECPSYFSNRHCVKLAGMEA